MELSAVVVVSISLVGSGMSVVGLPLPVLTEANVKYASIIKYTLNCFIAILLLLETIYAL